MEHSVYLVPSRYFNFKACSISGMVKRIRIGYMRIKKIHGLMKVEVIPIKYEDAMKLLKGEESASKS